MLRIISNALFIVILILSFSNSQNTTFQKTYNYLEASAGYSVINTSDGNFLVVGRAGNYSEGVGRILLSKIDLSGDILWTKLIGDSLDTESIGRSVLEIENEEYILCGTSDYQAITNKGKTGFLISVDKNGDVIWETSSEIHGYSVIKSSDGNYVVAGYDFTSSENSEDYLISKFTSIGSSSWTTVLGSTEEDRAISVVEMEENIYLTVGYISESEENRDIFLCKLNSNGDTLLTQRIGGLLDDSGSDLIKTTDGNYIISGFTSSFGNGGYDVYLIKLNSNLDISWTKTYGGLDDDFGSSIDQTIDGGYILTGVTKSYGSGNRNVYLIRTDSNGDTLWTRTFGGINDDIGRSVIQVPDGGFLITGYSTSNGNENGDLYLIKTDENGITLLHNNTSHLNVNNFILNQNYPNPFNPSTKISFYLKRSGFVSLDIYNLAGKKVTTIFQGKLNTGNHEYRFNGKKLASGIYFYNLKTQGSNETRKMVLIQ